MTWQHLNSLAVALQLRDRHAYMTANNTKNSLSAIAGLFNDVGDFGDGYRQVETIQSSNFLWFGPKRVFTPLHHDLTNNMLVQIYGRKKITLIPAMQSQWLYNDKGVFSSLTSLENPDFAQHPLLKHVSKIEFILEPGQAVFIPIGWWHYVESLDTTISVTFTNFNAPNSYSGAYPK